MMLFKIATVLSALLATTNALSLNKEGLSRRGAISTAFGISALVAQAHVASAGSAPPSKEELDRIRLGYKQITYLLEHFEESTTTCRDNGGECKRDAEPIRRVLGLRSTTDPLFQIDKVFVKVKNMDIDSDKLEDFFEASEDWNSALTMSNSMAFISQFGEYNPGGGKDEVLKFLLEAQKQVELAKSSLKTIMVCLDISE
jgi:Ca2+ transporting ATPase